MTRKCTSPASQEHQPDEAPDAGSIAVSQGPDEYKVGPGHPPKEYQFKPGQSGNPNGPPPARTHLWSYICQFMGMTTDERAKVDHAKLTAAQETAFQIVEKAVAGRGCDFERLARYIVDREEGKAAEHIIINDAGGLTDAECAELRSLILKNQAGKPDGCDAD